MAKKTTDKFQIYHGTAPPDTHDIIKEKSFLKDGICLNVFHGFAKIKKDFANAEDLSLEIFMDNGSFERYTYAYSKSTKIPASKRIPLDVYYSEKSAMEYFELINNEYQKLFDASKHPERLIITVPEVIASGPMTQKLQAKYLPLYKKLQQKYGFKMIISMQFNPHVDDWAVGLRDSARFIAKKIDIGGGIRVGVPFGNDFKVIQNLKRFKEVDTLFKEGGPLEGQGAHLFAAGSPTKVVKFAENWVDSVDSSTVNNWARYAHYMSSTGKYIDVRDLQGRAKSKEGKPPKKETVLKAWATVRADGIEPSIWMARKTEAQNWRYEVMLINLDQVIAKNKGWPAPKHKLPRPPPGLVPETDYPAAEFVDMPQMVGSTSKMKANAGKMKGSTSSTQKPAPGTKRFIRKLVVLHGHLVKLTPAEGQPYHNLFTRYATIVARMLGWEDGRIKNLGKIGEYMDMMANKLYQIEDKLPRPASIKNLLHEMDVIRNTAKKVDDGWYKTTSPPRTTTVKSNKAEMAVGGNLYYFQPIPDGILFNMEDVRAKLAEHGLKVTKTRFKPSVGAKIHQVTLEIDPADAREVQKVENEIDAYMKSSPIMQGGKRSIIVQATPKAELVFVIEDGISRVFEGVPDDVEGY